MKSLLTARTSPATAETRGSVGDGPDISSATETGIGSAPVEFERWFELPNGDPNELRVDVIRHRGNRGDSEQPEWVGGFASHVAFVRGNQLYIVGGMSKEYVKRYNDPDGDLSSWLNGERRALFLRRPLPTAPQQSPLKATASSGEPRSQTDALKVPSVTVPANGVEGTPRSSATHQAHGLPPRATVSGTSSQQRRPHPRPEEPLWKQRLEEEIQQTIEETGRPYPYQWSEVPDDFQRPPPFDGHVGFYFEDIDSYIGMGGRCFHGQQWSAMSYSFVDSTWRASTITPLDGFCYPAAVQNTNDPDWRIIAFGGISSDPVRREEYTLNDLFVYSHTKKSITKFSASAFARGTVPVSRMKASAALLGTHFYVFGGYHVQSRDPADSERASHIGRSGFLDDLHYLDIVSKVWTRVDYHAPPRESLRFPLHRSRCFCIPLPRHCGFLLGGGMYIDNYRCDDLLFFDGITKQFYLVHPGTGIDVEEEAIAIRGGASVEGFSLRKPSVQREAARSSLPPSRLLDTRFDRSHPFPPNAGEESQAPSQLLPIGGSGLDLIESDLEAEVMLDRLSSTSAVPMGELGFLVVGGGVGDTRLAPPTDRVVFGTIRPPSMKRKLARTYVTTLLDPTKRGHL